MKQELKTNLTPDNWLYLATRLKNKKSARRASDHVAAGENQ
jgi:hypothetical protein